jgi:hypothetical protein
MAATLAAAPLDAEQVAALRLDLTNQGVRLGEDVIAAGFDLALASTGNGVASEGVDLILPGGWSTNVCIAPGYARTSPYVLALGAGGALELRHPRHGVVPVSVPDTARFRHERTHSGVSCGDIGAVHGRWLVMAPFGMRDAAQLDRPRRFLGLPPVRPLQKNQWSVDEVVACAEAAWTHAGARLVHLEAGHLLRDDGGLADLSPYIVAIKRALPTLVSVSALPPSDPALALDLYAAGCDAISYHLLAFDAAAAAQVAPVRSRFVSHERLMNGLVAAARVFPRGAVSTDLLLGLEPLEHVSAALPSLTTQGIVPNLALFRPLQGGEDDVPAGTLVPSEPIVALRAERGRHLKAHGLWHSRVRGFPRTLWGFDPYVPSFIDRAYAGMRRALRVERVTT